MSTKVMDCDLVVLGAGGSGLVAAVKAADVIGKKVIILEKAKRPGGATNFAGGLRVANSKWAKAAGITSQGSSGPPGGFGKDKNSNERAAGYPKRGNGPGPGASPEVTDQFFDWLVEKGGAEKYFKLNKNGIVEMPKRMDKYANHPDPSIGPGRAGTYVVEKMVECCEKQGIPILTETRAKKFITDSQGKVTGVIADIKNGELQVNCKACYIGAGGFGADYERLKKLWPEDHNGKTLFHLCPPACTGDCINMAEEIGAGIDMSVAWLSMAGPVHHPYSYTIYRIMQEPEVVYINLDGERYVDETKNLSAKSAAILGQQPKAEMYAVADSEIIETLGQRIIATPWEESDLPILKRFREDIAYEVSLDERKMHRGNHTKKADSLVELALKMDVDPKTFVATIERYNAICEKGEDKDFGKKSQHLKPVKNPPFYAFWGQRFTQCAHGGIVINNNGEVLDIKGNVMPGLYAGGDGTSCNDNGGGGLSGAVNSGYVGGISAGEYLKKI
jgi:succinate dehydrogenase/fumarate reductase flavoprotein subunit